MAYQTQSLSSTSHLFGKYQQLILFLLLIISSIHHAHAGLDWKVINSNLKLNRKWEQKLPTQTIKLPPWDYTQPIIIDIDPPLLQGEFSAILIVPAESEQPKAADTNRFRSIRLNHDHLYLEIINGTRIKIKPKAFYLPMRYQNDHLKPAINLPFDTPYHLYLEHSPLQPEQANQRLFQLLSFRTPELSVFKTYSPQPISDSLNWKKRLSNLEKLNLNISQQQHGKTTAIEPLREFTGEDVRIALMDDGIRKNSNAGKRIVFRLLDIPDHLLGAAGKHGTLMANLLLDYAPDVQLLDYNVFPAVMHSNYWFNQAFLKHQIPIHDYPKLAVQHKVDLLNVSLVNSSLGKRPQQWTDAIEKGLIISKSLGNFKHIKHRIEQQNCFDPINFLPYLPLFQQSIRYTKGALITLQAALKSNTNQYLSLRSPAGDAAAYTLTVLETGRGATSQAAATFSAIFAIIKQAAIRYNRNYSPKQLVEILVETAQDIGAPGVDPIFGHGLVNINQALLEIEKGHAPSHQLYQDLPYINQQAIDQFIEHGCKTQ